MNWRRCGCLDVGHGEFRHAGCFVEQIEVEELETFHPEARYE